MQIIFEDDNIIAVNKPPGVSTIPNTKTSYEESLAGMVEEHCQLKIYVVHRLDKDTSGIVLFAKNADAHRNLSMQFEERKVTKKYLGIVKGKPGFENTEVNIPISRSKIRSKKVALSSHGIPAHTKIINLGGNELYSVFAIEPVTGRRHQIRLHLKAIGHPLAIDLLYGNIEHIALKDGTFLERSPLHAMELNFCHPVDSRPVSMKAPLFEDMRSFALEICSANKKARQLICLI